MGRATAEARAREGGAIDLGDLVLADVQAAGSIVGKALERVGVSRGRVSGGLAAARKEAADSGSGDESD